MHKHFMVKVAVTEHEHIYKSEEKPLVRLFFMVINIFRALRQTKMKGICVQVRCPQPLMCRWSMGKSYYYFCSILIPIYFVNHAKYLIIVCLMCWTHKYTHTHIHLPRTCSQIDEIIQNISEHAYNVYMCVWWGNIYLPQFI